MAARLRWFPGRRPPGNSVLTARLLDALARPGCPLCRVVASTVGHHLEALLDEHVTLPRAHRHLLPSRGFCSEHTWAFPPAALAAQSARGVALLYTPLLADLLRHWEDPARRWRWLVPETPCSLCAIVATTTSAYLAEYVHLLLEPPPGAESTDILCLPHLRALAPRLAAARWDRLASATGEVRRGEGAAQRLALLVGPRPVDPFPPEPHCPACAAATEAAGGLRATAGLCRTHAWARFSAGETTIAEAEDLGADSGPECPACRAGAAAAELALTQRQPAHRLCLHHLRQAHDREWLDADIAYWSLVQLERDLERFIEGGKATFVGTLTPDERRSWLAALARFGGEAPGAGLTLPIAPGVASATRIFHARHPLPAADWG